MRAISNKLPQGYFLNKNYNCPKAHSGIQDIIKTSKHKIMNRCTHAITILTQHFTFLKLFFPVFPLINDSYIKMKKISKILQVRNLNFLLSVKHFEKLQFLENRKKLTVIFAFLFIDLSFPQHNIVSHQCSKNIESKLQMYPFDFSWFLKKNNTEFYCCTWNISLYNFILINGNFLQFNTFNCQKSKIQMFPI